MLRGKGGRAVGGAAKPGGRPSSPAAGHPMRSGFRPVDPLVEDRPGPFQGDGARRVHELTADVSRDPVAEDFMEYLGSKYQPSALRKIIRYEQVIHKRAGSKYIVPASLDHLLFEAAEKVYRGELTRLAKTIRRQIEIRNRQMSNLNREIEGVDHSVLDQVGPYHPLNIARNGTLTERGNDVCFRLFALGLSDLAVAHLMRVSLRAIKVRRRLLPANPAPPADG